MELKMYSLFDKKVGVHSTPMFFAHEGYFIRAVTEIVKDPSTNVGRYPADFDLHFLGTFDDNTGVFNQVQGIRSLGSAASFLPARADTAPMFEGHQAQQRMAEDEQHPLMGVN